MMDSQSFSGGHRDRSSYDVLGGGMKRSMSHGGGLAVATAPPSGRKPPPPSGRASVVPGSPAEAARRLTGRRGKDKQRRASDESSKLRDASVAEAAKAARSRSRSAPDISGQKLAGVTRWIVGGGGGSANSPSTTPRSRITAPLVKALSRSNSKKKMATVSVSVTGVDEKLDDELDGFIRDMEEEQSVEMMMNEHQNSMKKKKAAPTDAGIEEMMDEAHAREEAGENRASKRDQFRNPASGSLPDEVINDMYGMSAARGPGGGGGGGEAAAAEAKTMQAQMAQQMALARRAEYKRRASAGSGGSLLASRAL